MMFMPCDKPLRVEPSIVPGIGIDERVLHRALKRALATFEREQVVAALGDVRV